ncbi:hypothetical protein AbraIFM66950_002123 [Aspergillus brasiliensis]|nr:hypothetical protein AbraIFM66950_002123 [Aspergillus brasiliensis]
MSESSTPTPKGIHISRMYCALCVDHPTPRERIFNLDENELSLDTVSDCDIECELCKSHPYPLLWIHTRCYQLLIASYEPSGKPSMKDIKDYALATAELYPKIYPECGNPGTILEGLSSPYTACLIPESFRRSFFDKTPPEIRRRIAGFVGPCWYLAILGEARRLIEYIRQNKEPQEDKLDVINDLWMSRILCQDHSYVSRLSDKPLKATEGTEVVQIQLPKKIRNVIISKDHLGVRGIQFLDREAPTQDQSPWYEMYDVEGSYPTLFIEHHCPLIKRIDFEHEKGSPSKTFTWTSPFAPALHQLNNAPLPWLYWTPLHYMKLGPPVKGLIVAFYGGNQIVGIHNFSGRNKAFWEFMDWVRHCMNWQARKSGQWWFYFPLNDGEDIQGAWIRNWKCSHGHARTVATHALILQTSLGRRMTFGPVYPDFYTNDCDYISLVGDTDGPVSGIFHDGLDSMDVCIQMCGVTCDSPRDGQTPVLVPMRDVIQPPGVDPGDDRHPWFMTKATLMGLTKVQVCRDRTQPHHPCLGMLMFYADGHVESSGQIRWDYGLDEEICCPIMVIFGVVDRKVFIKDIQSVKDKVESTVRSRDRHILPAEGMFVWWFSELGDRLAIYQS